MLSSKENDKKGSSKHVLNLIDLAGSERVGEEDSN
jgi:hypothetical protein